MKIRIKNNNIKTDDISIHNNGTKFSYLNNNNCRVDGPAYEWNNGDESWYLEDKEHRKYGPSFKWRIGDKWFLEGKEYTQEEFMEKFL